MDSPDDPFPMILLGAFAGQPLSFFVVIGIVLVILLLLSGLISGSEVAFFSLSHDQIASCRHSEDKNKKRVSGLLHSPKRLLATILIANNLVNILIVTISTFVTWRVVGQEGKAGVTIALLTIIVTLVIIFFGEIIPKVYANHNRMSFAKRVSGLLVVASRLFQPVSWFLISLTDIIEQRMRKKKYSLSVEEVNQALEIFVEREGVTKEEKEILKGVVNFGTLSVKQVMRSRMDITAIDIETDFHELMNQVNKTGYSRIPIYIDTIDKIEGILYVKDLLPHLEKEETFEWQALLREGFFIPESKNIDDLFKDFQEKQVHIAIVIDEYGGTSGLITMEDVLEEIVGEINDEFDESEIPYQKLDNHTYLFEGKTSLNDFCKVVNIETAVFEEVKGESESLGGLLLELHSTLPHAGKKIRFKEFLFTVVAVDQKKIKRIRVHINLNPEEVNVAKFNR